MADNSRLLIGVKSVSTEDGVPLYKVAIWNEFGTETAPPRPAFRMGTERGIKKNSKMIKAFMANIGRDMMRGKSGKALTKQRTKILFTTLGKSSVSEIKKIIQSGETAPNAPRTIAKKGFDHPLFETGLLLKSVEYAIEVK